MTHDLTNPKTTTNWKNDFSLSSSSKPELLKIVHTLKLLHRGISLHAQVDYKNG